MLSSSTIIAAKCFSGFSFPSSVALIRPNATLNLSLKLVKAWLSLDILIIFLYPEILAGLLFVVSTALRWLYKPIILKCIFLFLLWQHRNVGPSRPPISQKWRSSIFILIIGCHIEFLLFYRVSTLSQFVFSLEFYELSRCASVFLFYGLGTKVQ